MAFQSTVRQFQADGLPGEIAEDGPTRARTWILDSDGTAQTVGYAYTWRSDGIARVGTAAQEFAGILVRPKELPLLGDGSTALGPFYNVPDNQNGELLTKGLIFVALANAGVYGDGVFYTDATGALSAGTAGGGQTQIANAKVVRDTPGGAGLSVIELL